MKCPVPPRCQRGLRGLPRAACPCLRCCQSRWSCSAAGMGRAALVPSQCRQQGCLLPQADFGMFQAASPCREPRPLCAGQCRALLLQDTISHPNSSLAGDRSPQQSGLWDWHSSGTSSHVPTRSCGGPGVFRPLCWSIRAQVQVTPREHPSNTISEASRPGQMVGEGEKVEALRVASSEWSSWSSLTPATCKPTRGKIQFMVASVSPSLCVVTTLWLCSGPRRGAQEGGDPVRGVLVLLEAGTGLVLPRYPGVHQSGMP